MRARSLMSIVAAAGIALAATACGSDDGGSGDNGAAGTHNESSVEQTSRAAAPAQSAQDLLLDAGEFPAGTGFSALPEAALDGAMSGMGVPEGAVIEPAECADKASNLNVITSRGDVAMTAGNADGGQLMLAVVIVKDGPGVAELRAANEKCPEVKTSTDAYSSTGTSTVSDGPKIDYASESVQYTVTSTGTAMGTTIDMVQYGLAVEVGGVTFLVNASSLNDSGTISEDVKNQVKEIAQAQASKIAAAG